MSQPTTTETAAKQVRRPVDTSGRRTHAKKQTRWSEFRYKNGGSLGALFGLIAAWQLYIWIAQPNPRVLPGPFAVLREVYRMWDLGLLGPAAAASARGYVVGVTLAIAVGIVLSALIGLSKLAQVVTMPYLWAMFSMPRVALIPLLILWFGLGFNLVVAAVFLSAVVPLIIQVIEGMRTVDGSMLRMAQMFTASRRDTLRKVILPSTVPYVANGMRQCLSRGFIGLVVTEMLAGAPGLGREAMRASQSFNTARVMGMILILVVASVILVMISRVIENSVSKWRETVAV